MGASASNLSRTNLNLTQSAVTEVAQKVKANAGNISNQQIQIAQNITLVNGSADVRPDPCLGNLNSVVLCKESLCAQLDADAIYRCNIITNPYTGQAGPVSEEMCDEAFGPSSEMNDNDGLCDGTNVNVSEMSDSDRRKICSMRVVRQNCMTNPSSSFTPIEEIKTEGDNKVGKHSCTTSADCEAGFECTEGQCDYGVDCSSNDDCVPEYYYCSSYGYCTLKLSCNSDADCPMGDPQSAVCVNGVCGLLGDVGWADNGDGEGRNECKDACKGDIYYLIESYDDVNDVLKFDVSNVSNVSKEELEINDIGNCVFNPVDPENNVTQCYTVIDTEDIYGCSLVQNSAGYFNGSDSDENAYVRALEVCFESCNSYRCTDTEQKLYNQKANLVCMGQGGGFCTENSTNTTMVSSQTANSQIDASMTTYITNDFHSTVVKTITQANEGINFSQHNNSQEATDITQKIKNLVTQKLEANAENVQWQWSKDNLTQTVTNYGNMVGIAPGDGQICDLGITEDDGISVQCVNVESGNDGQSMNGGNSCGCSLNNESLVDLESTQQSQAVVEAIMNTSVTNTLASLYSFTLEQLNKGVELNFVWIIVALIFGGAMVIVALIYLKGKILDTVSDGMKNGIMALIFISVLGFIGTLVGGVYYFLKQSSEDDEEENEEYPNDFRDPLTYCEPYEDEVRCDIVDSAGCNTCKLFIKTDFELSFEQDTYEAMCEQRSKLYTATDCDKLINQTGGSESGIPDADKIHDDGGIEILEFSKNKKIKLCEESKDSGCCNKRNFNDTDNGIRMVCNCVNVDEGETQPPACAPTIAPTVAPTDAPVSQ
jgi:hypothetical protein